MNIGFDGKRAANNKTGLGNYSRSLIEQAALLNPANDYLVYTPKANTELLSRPVFNLGNVKIRLPRRKGIAALWRSFGIVKLLISDEVKLFHGLSHEIPFGLKRNKIKSIVTIHDLIFLTHPRFYKALDRLIYTFKSRYACRQANRIIAISEQTKKDIIRFYGISPGKIDVVYQSCDEQFKSAISQQDKTIVCEKYKLPANYILSVGTIEERKNLMLLIKAMPAIDPSCSLVVIGKETKYAQEVKKEIERLGLQKRILFLKNVPFTDLPTIYQSATVFAYPSRYEGFGIPVIEALYSGVPVVAATGSCLEEAGGHDSIYISPDDHHRLSGILNELLTNKNLRELMIAKGYDYVQRFNTDRVTAQLMQVYHKTLLS